MAREGPAPAMCSKRDEYEMALPSSGECVRWRGRWAETSQIDRWVACTHGVRASAVMLHGIPAGEHAPGGRARSAVGAVDELRAAAQQRRRRKAKQHLGPTRLPNTRLPPTAVAMTAVMHTAPAAGEGWAGSRASVWQAESRRDERWERWQRRAELKPRFRGFGTKEIYHSRVVLSCERAPP